MGLGAAMAFGHTPRGAPLSPAAIRVARDVFTGAAIGCADTPRGAAYARCAYVRALFR